MMEAMTGEAGRMVKLTADRVETSKAVRGCSRTGTRSWVYGKHWENDGWKRRYFERCDAGGADKSLTRRMLLTHCALPSSAAVIHECLSMARTTQREHWQGRMMPRNYEMDWALS